MNKIAQKDANQQNEMFADMVKGMMFQTKLMNSREEEKNKLEKKNRANKGE